MPKKILFHLLILLSIGVYQPLVAHAPSEPTLQEITQLWEENKPDQAYRTFLQLIEKNSYEAHSSAALVRPPSAQEEAILAELEILHHRLGDSSIEANSQEILIKGKQFISTYGYTPRVGYYLAISYANLEQFTDFFKEFFAAYQMLPLYYLSYKARSVLYFKLHDMEYDQVQKSLYRQKGIDLLSSAIQSHPQDPASYKLLFIYLPPEKRREYLNTYIPSIIQNEVAIPRKDVYFYVYQCALQHQFQLARQMIDHARHLYRYSRNVDAAEELLDQVMSGETALLHHSIP